ncbi:Exonuclease domain-containing protein [Caenorhabditis elegans]|uniref:Exonuclease domain-containing protein n=2 Tax=Caenorhabditis elegans TaxID=6239 RepID=Q9U220_CAEEL|nr:Exonuclease domain-containing protein [Caenorhabditis elegans]CAB60521.2 Exonuclease domain-containing protein [Caenorhabditis elegans]
MVIELHQLKKKRTGASLSSISSTSSEELSIPVEPLQKMAPAKLYNELLPLKLSFEQLKQNGYPFWCSTSSQAVFAATANNKKDWAAPNDFYRKCSRCSKGFYLNPDGTANAQKCVYHHRAKWDPLTGKKHLPCCSAKPGPSTKGCLVEDRHVFSQSWEDTLWEFVVSPQAKGKDDHRSNKVFALDCELVHTLNGLEVARVSLVDMKGKVLLDTFALPVFEVISFNSTFSGVTEKDMESAISLEACRLQLFQLINSETLLVGHSLESDLKALRLVHHNVIDTAVLFSIVDPSRSYILKLSLQNLAKKYLCKDVQSEASGHSSIEDSHTCMELLATRHLLSVKL